jgi:hypothetical protein
MNSIAVFMRVFGVALLRGETKTVCIIILYCTGMDMGMRFTIPKYPRGIGAIKCKGLPHTPRGQSKGDCFYIGNKIRAKKTSTVCKKEIP